MRARAAGLIPGLIAGLIPGLIAGLLVPLLVIGPASAASSGEASAAESAAPVGQPLLPPTDTDFDYQLGGVKALPHHVGIVARDRTAAPAPHAYSICYINGFQTQPDQKSFWRRHWRLVLKSEGQPVVDSAWGEWLLDIRTPAKRAQLAAIMGRWIAGCATDGFEAVEFDNLDSYTRSNGLLTGAQASAYARALVASAHKSGLAAGQKNRAGWDGRRVGYDFAIAEECGRWRECGSYTKFFGREVLVIEYRPVDFRYTCRRFGARLPVVRRDLALTPGGVHRYC